MSSRAIALWLAAALVATSVQAQNVAVKSDHPGTYVVQTGDTLWDIAGRFLNEPWAWPQVWEANRHIANPHLIYPGDEVMLSHVAGRPVLRVRRHGRPTVKLSPTVRARQLDTAVPTIPIDAIHQFLKRPRVMSEADLEASPYIVSFGAEALMARPGGKMFARGIGPATGDRFAVYRRGQEYVDADGVVLGLEALHVGNAVLDTLGDPATLVVTGMKREIQIGDKLVPLEEDDIDHHFLPRPLPDGVEGQIIAVVDGVTQIGQHAVVVVDVGESSGIEPGHVMAVFQSGETVLDATAKPPSTGDVQGRTELELDPAKQGGVDGALHAVNDAVNTLWNQLTYQAGRFDARTKPWQEMELPAERAGTVMVFRPFERVSYALVMEASRAMHVYDSVRNP